MRRSATRATAGLAPSVSVGFTGGRVDATPFLPDRSGVSPLTCSPGSIDASTTTRALGSGTRTTVRGDLQVVVIRQSIQA